MANAARRAPVEPNGLRFGVDWRRVRALRPSASAVIFDRRGRVLLQPGGGMEIGETITDTVIREVREETGLVVSARRLIGVYSDPAMQVVAYPDGNVWQYLNVCFECVVHGGTLTTCDETLALDWFPPRRLPATILPNHVIRIRDARTRRVAAFVR